MAEKIAFDIATKVLSSLGSIATQNIELAWGVEKELDKLNGTVSTVKNVLLDAQEQQASSNAVKDWLHKLKEILYDADDLLDEVATEAQRRELKTHNRLMRKVRYLNPKSLVYFPHKVGSKIEDIVKRLNDIVSQMRDFQFIVKEVESPIETIRREETFPHVNITRRIICRRDDIDAFVNLLLSSGYQENVITIPIVGIGGLGKTTLAQLVYRDNMIKSEFPKRLWISISTNFDIKRLLIKILKEGEGLDDSCNNNGFQELQEQVIRMFRTNKFLLFLDDVWNENRVEWARLEDLWEEGANGSRVVVTTRSMTVAEMVRTSIVEPYKLRGLSDEESSTLLVQWAFNEGEEKKHDNLVDIGKEIVKICGGVPLAVVTLGSLLSSKRDHQFWLSVRNDEMWALAQMKNQTDILPVLRLSYDQMPSNLKQCFAYCSLFERGEIIDGKKLLYAWIAQGFVQHEGNCELEHIGERYILELVNRFFLEPYDGQSSPNTTGRKHYKMHSLVHILAQDVAGNECKTIKGGNTYAIPIPKTLRHVAFVSQAISEFPKPLMKAKKMRTLFHPRKKNPTCGSSVETKSTSFRCLRVCAFQDLKKIRKLKLLRYLSLNEVDSLPKSLCKLLNLQYLDLYLSGDLKLPKEFRKLINLRFLCLSTKSVRLPNKEIGMLTSLRTLIIFHCEALTSLEGIEHLSGLRELALESCSELPLLPAGLKFLTSLESLEISSCRSLNLSDDDLLMGLTSLKQLKLCELPGLVSLPMGLLEAAGTLTHLEIECCLDFTSPSESVLPKLKSLKSLKIWDCGRVGSLPEGMDRLSGLQFVSIVDCPLFKANYDVEQGVERQKIAHVRTIFVELLRAFQI